MSTAGDVVGVGSLIRDSVCSSKSDRAEVKNIPIAFEEFALEENYEGMCKLSPEALVLQKQSVYSAEAVARVQEVHGIKGVQRLTKGFGAVMFQLAAFFFSIFITAGTPLIYEWALWNSETQRKEANYVGMTLYACYYGFSALLAVIVSVLSYEKKVYRECWNVKTLHRVILAALLWVMYESMDGIIMLVVTSDLKMVLSQMRIPVIALASYIWLGRKHNALQAVIIAGVVASVVGYGVARMTSVPVPTAIGMVAMAIQVSSAALGSLVCEVSFQSDRNPFPVQMARMKLMTCLIAALLVVPYARIVGQTEQLVFKGWTWKIVVLGLWLTLRDWSQTFVLKILSAMYKALGNALALGVTYFAETIVNRRPFNEVLVMFTIAIVIEVVCYTVSKRMAADMDQVTSKLQELQKLDDNKNFKVI